MVDLIGFFKMQYCAVQEYTHRQEFQVVKIYRIHDQDHEGWMQLLVDTS